jgi:lipopolysaccharide export system permease protein
VIKKLDILVLKAFVGPFIATFFLTLFVLILQFFWLWIDDFVGKGLDGLIIIRLIIYLSATLVPLALPLAVLLSSIMTFGNLGETFELVAIKSAGIGLLRFMRSLTVTTLLLAGLAFFFNNYVIPVANLKMKTLHYDMVNKKPAFDLKEGTFYNNLPGFSIKVSSKQNDSILNDVIIYENSVNAQDNMIAAKRGIMRLSANKQFLEFTLQDGWRYEENGERTGTNTRFYRLGFKEYKKMLDLSSLQMAFTSDSTYKDRYEMLNVRQLSKTSDSLERLLNAYLTGHRIQMQTYLPFTQYVDTGWKQVTAKPVKLKDTSFLRTLPDSARSSVLDQAISYTNSVKSTLDVAATEYESKRKELRMHLMTWHEKFTMSIAVLVLFLIGAPLGSIVRKGGIGTPVIFAVLFFVIFFLLNNFGKKFVKEDVLQPVAGTWLATIVLLPIGFFLIYKAMHDSQLFNKEFYFRSFRALRARLSKKKPVDDKKAPAEPAEAEEVAIANEE